MKPESGIGRRADDYDRIGAALRHLLQNRRRPVRLAELAEVVGLSPFHFQRLFTRWAGITPKRFAQYLALDDARRLLRPPRPLLHVTDELGMSSLGRLHDLFVTIDAVTPGEFKSGGAGLEIAWGEHDSPFGRCLLGLSQRGICWLSFADAVEDRDGPGQLRAGWPAAVLRHDPRATRPVAARIFSDSGDRSRGPLQLLVGGTNFQVKVWEALIRIPPGEVVTYAEVAAAIGHSSACRAVGSAVGANRISYLIPCHRVIRAMGVVSEYRWGPVRKRAMLAREAAQFGDGAVAAEAPAAASAVRSGGSCSAAPGSAP